MPRTKEKRTWVEPQEGPKNLVSIPSSLQPCGVIVIRPKRKNKRTHPGRVGPVKSFPKGGLVRKKRFSEGKFIRGLFI